MLCNWLAGGGGISALRHTAHALPPLQDSVSDHRHIAKIHPWIEEAEVELLPAMKRVMLYSPSPEAVPHWHSADRAEKPSLVGDP